jgi:RNA polymerase sigma-70 factor (ECF subfamily)
LSGITGKQNRGRRLSSKELGEVYRQKGVLVLRRCKTILHEKAEAEDVLQEVFIRLMRYGQFEKAEEVPLAWLYRTAERCCFDRIKKIMREPAGISEEKLDSLEVPGVEARHQASEMIVRFLHKLDDKMKTVALMHYLDGMTQEQIAAELGWSRRTVGTKIKFLKKRAAKLAGHEKERESVSPLSY